MNSKLEYLAQKEEELRKLNEQIDASTAKVASMHNAKNNNDLPPEPADGGDKDAEVDAMLQEEQDEDGDEYN